MTQEINKQLNMIHYDKNDTIKKDMNMNVCIWMDGSKNIRHIMELGEPELAFSRSIKENIKKMQVKYQKEKNTDLNGITFGSNDPSGISCCLRLAECCVDVFLELTIPLADIEESLENGQSSKLYSKKNIIVCIFVFPAISARAVLKSK